MKQTRFFNGTLNFFYKKAEDIARDNDDLYITDYMTTEDSCMITIIFHNFKGYDSHLIMQHITSEYAPSSIDTFLSFQIGNLCFLDSLQFLTASLDMLVQSLTADGKDKSRHSSRH